MDLGLVWARDQNFYHDWSILRLAEVLTLCSKIECSPCSEPVVVCGG